MIYRVSSDRRAIEASLMLLSSPANLVGRTNFSCLVCRTEIWGTSFTVWRPVGVFCARAGYYLVFPLEVVEEICSRFVKENMVGSRFLQISTVLFPVNRQPHFFGSIVTFFNLCYCWFPTVLYRKANLLDTNQGNTSLQSLLFALYATLPLSCIPVLHHEQVRPFSSLDESLGKHGTRCQGATARFLGQTRPSSTSHDEILQVQQQQ